MTAPVPPRSGVRRSRTGAVLGGVCAGVARSAGLDPLLLRIAVVAVTLLTGGAGLLAYLAAWGLIPPDEPSGTDGPAPGAADDAATALGERLRAPESQAEARRTAAGVDEVGGRDRRDRTPPAPEQDQAPDHG